MTKHNPNKLPREERLHAIKNRIRNAGIDRLPTYRAMAEEYGVTHVQIVSDMKTLISEMDPQELDKCFTNFYESDIRALEILKMIMQGKDTDPKTRIMAINSLVTLQDGISKLLESFHRKQTALQRSAHLNIEVRPDSAASMYEISQEIEKEEAELEAKEKMRKFT